MREHHRDDERRFGGHGQGRHRRGRAEDWRQRPEGRRFAQDEGEGSWGGLGDTGREEGRGRGEGYGPRGYGDPRYEDEGYGRQGGGQQRSIGRPVPEAYGHSDQRRRGSGRGRSGPEEWRQIRRDDVGVAQEADGLGGGYGRDGQWGDERAGDQDWAQPLYAGPNRDVGEGAFWQGRGQQGRGPHAGKGPRGWSRSDDRILEDVCEALARDPEIDASDVEVSCSGGEVTLRGSVDSRRTRRRAEEVIEDLPGVRDVRNELRTQRVQGEGVRGGEGQSGEGGAGAPVREGELSPGGRVVSGDKIG